MRTTRNRTEWKAKFPHCFWCGMFAGHCHEILRGVYRSQAVREPATWLKLCDQCHDMIHATPKEFGLVEQLVMKQIWDPWHYDLTAVMEIRNGLRRGEVITERDVLIRRREMSAVVCQPGPLCV